MFGHLDAGPLFYGVIIALGIYSMLYKLKKGDWLALFVEVGVFYIVFKMHGGTMTGGMSAAICALIVGVSFRKVISWMK